MTSQEYYEATTGEKALYHTAYCAYHTLRYILWLESRLESRLAEEIRFRHRNCTQDDCKSSGTACPANDPGNEDNLEMDTESIGRDD